MVRYNAYKRTLIVAALVIMLCLSAIIGSTLALFTAKDDGSIGVNATAGYLKVDIVDDTEAKNSLVGEVLKLQDKSGRSDEEIYFEPGAAFYTQGFRVENEGDISIHYIIYLSGDENVPDGFFDAFDVFVTNDVSSRDALVPIHDINPYLGPGEVSDVYYLVVRMNQDVENEFSDIPAFEAIGITVCAFQANADIE